MPALALFRKKLEVNDLARAVAIVSLVFLATGILGSFIYDENDEPAMESLFRGLYFDTPVTNIDFGGFKGISFLYVFLYSKLDIGINYFGMSLIIFNWLAFVVLVFILLKKIPAHAFLWSLAFLFLAFYNIFIVSFTTTAIWLSFAGLALFDFAMREIEPVRIKIPAILLSWILVIIAYQIRPPSGVLSFILFVPAFCWHFASRKKSNYKIPSLLIMIPILLSVLIARQIDKKTFFKNDFCRKAINIYSKINNYGYTLNASNKTQEKLLFEVKNWFFIDKDTQDIKQFKNALILPQKRTNAKYALNYAFKSFFDRRSLIFYCIIGITLFLLISNRPSKVKVILFCLTMAYYLGVLLAIAIFMKIVPRILIPALLIAIYFVLMNFPEAFQLKKKQTSCLLRGALIFMLVLMTLYQGRSLARDLLKENQKAGKCLSELHEYLNAEKPEYIFMTWAYDVNYYPLKHIRWGSRNKLIPLVGWMSYYPQNYSFVRSLTGSNGIPEIFRWIVDHPHEATIYSDRENNLILNKILAYHEIAAFLVPTKILNKKTGKGFYRVSFAGV